MRSKTVLDHVRPTVVVRRRIYDPSQFHETAPGEPAALEAPRVAAEASSPPENAAVAPLDRSFLPTQSWGAAADDDEAGPPSSVNVARALAALRADELQRVEELIGGQDDDDDDDEDEAPTSSVIAPPRSVAFEAAPASLAPRSLAHVQPPTLRLPKSIPLRELAAKMSVDVGELVTAFVTAGFFTIAPTSTLPRETARIGAEMFGWRAEDMTEDEEAAASPARPRTKKKAAPAKAKAAARKTKRK